MEEDVDIREHLQLFFFAQNHRISGLCPLSEILNNMFMFSSYLEFEIIDKVHKPSDSEC
jgi:hypothetical protein